MQLFAIIARVDDDVELIEGKESITSSKGRKIVQLFLSQEIRSTQVDDYLKMFDAYLESHHSSQSQIKKDQQQKRTSLNSVKILRICSEINKELLMIQKVIILVRLIEFIFTNETPNEQEIEFIEIVAETFNISKEEYTDIYDFVSSKKDNVFDIEKVLYLTPEVKEDRWKSAKQIELEGLNGVIGILWIESVNAFFLRYIGDSQLIINGQIAPSKRQHIFTPGSSIRTTTTKSVYYSDVLSKFLVNYNTEKLIFKCENVEYKFSKKKTAIHEISFEENNGSLIGIMGGSGTGKTTLLNVLNGNLTPTSGKVTINGVDIHKNKKEIEGVIGYISQDDLLIEELTVFENLFYNARLCFKYLSKKQVAKKVVQILKATGLYSTRDLIVGSPLAKTISGGQRKRLNIALELIREPSILFVDEPTSGLGSRDSENIMGLLKELALKGKLIFVVIHQPSSEIFKLFNRLVIMDHGGYPIYYGDPIDSVVYFKSAIDHINSEERYCPTCGNVNSEQIFKIIETKVIDEIGNPTEERKVSPEEWNELFKKNNEYFKAEDYKSKPGANNKIPNKLKQFSVFITRDFLSKAANRQYILINTLVAPLLAIILALFVKYHALSSGKSYSFSNNENIPQFLFISVIVAIFLGLTMAAEEIIKDQKILKRESFLNLSKGSYLASKIIIMFAISALQTAVFVLIGNYILEIKGMWFYYWLILFSTSCFANLLGLNISAAFNSAKVIYILIPIMIIPQLLFSGVIVKFDKLHPWFAKETSVPWIGNAMTSRWAYEAMATSQFTKNDYEEPFFRINHNISQAAWKRDYWISEMKNQQNIYNTYHSDPSQLEISEKARQTLLIEIEKEQNLYDEALDFVCKGCIEALNNKTWDYDVNKSLSDYLNTLKKLYIIEVNANNKEKTDKILSIGEETVRELKASYFNESLSDVVRNRKEFDRIIVTDKGLVQKDDPIYKIAKHKNLINNHFYAPYKNLFGKMYSTFIINVMVIWSMIFVLTIALYFDIFKKIVQFLEKLTLSSKSN